MCYILLSVFRKQNITKTLEYNSLLQIERAARKHRRKVSFRGQLCPRQSALTHTEKPKGHERLLSFVTPYPRQLKQFTHPINVFALITAVLSMIPLTLSRCVCACVGFFTIGVLKTKYYKNIGI